MCIYICSVLIQVQYIRFYFFTKLNLLLAYANFINT